MAGEYDRLVGSVIASLEEAITNGGVAPWQKPWQTSARRPVNPFSGTEYSGINHLLLVLAGRADNRWVTFKQVADRGGKVNKGAKGVPVCYYGSSKRSITIEDENGEEVSLSKSFQFLKTYYVFNVADTTGLELPPLEEVETLSPVARIEACEAIVRGYAYWADLADSNGGPSLVEGGDVASYSPARDRISVPSLKNFLQAEAYYATLFHELVHSTGHESRLKRDFGTRFGDHLYSKEELVAELGSFFLGNVVQIDAIVRPNHEAYLGSWLRVLKADPKILIGAASAAQKAADLILGKS